MRQWHVYEKLTRGGVMSDFGIARIGTMIFTIEVSRRTFRFIQLISNPVM